MSPANEYSLTLPSDREIVMTRVFNAPRALVFKAFTDPEAIAQWWGQNNATTIVDKMDVRPGGVWRYVQRAADGNEWGFRGEYLEIVPPERLVNTFEFEGLPGHVVTDTAVFEEFDGKTRLTVTSTFDSQEDRDGMIASGMEDGALESYARLDAYLQMLQPDA